MSQQLTACLCREVIKTNGKLSLTENEKLQMAVWALRALEARAKVIETPPAERDGDSQ